jgi:iron(III) transport system permease protein
VAGKAFRPALLNLGPWRYLTLALAVVYLFVVVVLPTLALIVAAFRKFCRSAPSPACSMTPVQPDPLRAPVGQSARAALDHQHNGGRAHHGAVRRHPAFAVGYTIHRTSLAGRRSIDVLSTLPVAIPGLVIGVAYLWAWIGLPGGLYGTIWILALAFIARFMPDTVKALSPRSCRSIASWKRPRGFAVACARTIRTIVLPLARPGVIAAMTLLFVLAIRELGSSLFLYTSNTMVMAVCCSTTTRAATLASRLRSA